MTRFWYFTDSVDKGHKIGFPRVDFFVDGCMMLEIKAFEKIENIHKNQTINYLEVYNIADGLLINFGGASLDFKSLYNKKLINLPKSDES